ncbi:MAG TPA: hypothetical protein IAA29_15950 [Candidatus Paenibacillus intestinavium]|nr:hypothetical protein [Candidatus Paenibacillus intestinavium]
MSSVKLDNSKTSFDKLEEHYRGFIAPSFKIVINNKDIVREGMAVESVTVDTSITKKADMTSFSVTNAYDLIKRDFQWTNSLLMLGNSVEVSFGYTDRLTPIFFGYISNVEFDFSTDDVPLISIKAMDISFYMMRGGEPQVWANKKISDVVQEIGRKYGITSFDIETTPITHPKIVKNVENDHMFLEKLAKDLDFDFFIVGKKLYYRERTANKTPVMKLELGKHLSSFRLEQDISEQVTKVIVKATSRNQKKTITVESSKVDKIGSNSRTGPNILSKLGNFVEVIQKTVNDEAEARMIATSRMQERSMELVSAQGSCIGLPELRAGRYIELGGLGTHLNTIYYIESATHIIDDSGYRSNFNLQGNAV